MVYKSEVLRKQDGPQRRRCINLARTILGKKTQIMQECLECRRTSIINSYANLLRVSNVHESDHLCLMFGMWAFKLKLKLKAFKIILNIILIY